MALTIKPIKIYTRYDELLKEFLGDGYDKLGNLPWFTFPQYISKDEKTSLLDMDHLTDAMLGSIIDLIPYTNRAKLIITCRSYSRRITKNFRTGPHQVIIQKIMRQNTYNDLMNREV